jgi:hypothetical protein
LLKGKLVPFSFCHKHHLLKLNSYQMVLHRPVEPALVLSKVTGDDANPLYL